MPANHRERLFDDYIHVKIEKKIKRQFIAICKSRGHLPSVVFRNLVQKHINRNKAETKR